MASYQIEWKPSAVKELRRLPKQAVQRIYVAVDGLAEDPLPPGALKLSGSDRSYRIRVGDYRILYTVESDWLIVEIVRVGHRRDVYR